MVKDDEQTESGDVHRQNVDFRHSEILQNVTSGSKADPVDGLVAADRLAHQRPVKLVQDPEGVIEPKSNDFFSCQICAYYACFATSSTTKQPFFVKENQ